MYHPNVVPVFPGRAKREQAEPRKEQGIIVGGDALNQRC